VGEVTVTASKGVSALVFEVSCFFSLYSPRLITNFLLLVTDFSGNISQKHAN
jgi:hypothetical protein